MPSIGAENRKVQHFLVIAAAKDRWLHSMAFLVVECLIGNRSVAVSTLMNDSSGSSSSSIIKQKRIILFITIIRTSIKRFLLSYASPESIIVLQCNSVRKKKHYEVNSHGEEDEKKIFEEIIIQTDRKR